MNIGIDIDKTLAKYPKFFIELGRAWKARGHKVYIVTAATKNNAKKLLSEYPADFYDGVITSGDYNEKESKLIYAGVPNKIIWGVFKQRVCKEKKIVVLFDDLADIFNMLGKTPVFKVS